MKIKKRKKILKNQFIQRKIFSIQEMNNRKD